MDFEEKSRVILNLAEIQHYADEIGEYIDRMFIEVVMYENIPYVKVHNMMLSDFECRKLLHQLEMAFLDDDDPTELRWKAGVILDQVNQTIITSDNEYEGGDNGIERDH